MLSLYVREERQLERIRGVLPPEELLTVSDDWGQFEQLTVAADCAIVCVDWLHCDGAVRMISNFRRRFPFRPLVLVTRRDADNARHLKSIDIEDVVWLEEVKDELPSVVGSARTRTVLELLAATFEHSERLAPSIRHSLALACRAEPAISSVAELARAAGCDRRTLWRRWRKTLPEGVGIRLEDVLHWLLLIRAVGRKSPVRCWANIAAELGVHEHTLARLSRQLVGARLRDLDDLWAGTIVRTFVRRVLHPVVGETAWDRLG